MFTKFLRLIRKKSEPKEQPKIEIPARVIREVLREKIKSKKGSLEDLILFCDDTRKTIDLMKHTIGKVIASFDTQKALFEVLRRALIDLYVEYGNLKDKAKYLDKTDHERKSHSTTKKGEQVGESSNI